MHASNTIDVTKWRHLSEHTIVACIALLPNQSVQRLALTVRSTAVVACLSVACASQQVVTLVFRFDDSVVRRCVAFGWLCGEAYGGSSLCWCREVEGESVDISTAGVEVRCSNLLSLLV